MTQTTVEHVIRPLGNRVLIQAQAVKEKQSAGGVIIPGNINTKETYKSEVINIGPEVGLVKVGDLVLVTFMAGDGLDHDQQDYRIVEEDEILAIIAR